MLLCFNFLKVLATLGLPCNVQASLVMAWGLSCPIVCRICVPQPGIEHKSPALQGIFLTTGLPGKSKNTVTFKREAFNEISECTHLLLILIFAFCSSTLCIILLIVLKCNCVSDLKILFLIYCLTNGKQREYILIFSFQNILYLVRKYYAHLGRSHLLNSCSSWWWFEERLKFLKFYLRDLPQVNHVQPFDQEM